MGKLETEEGSGRQGGREARRRWPCGPGGGFGRPASLSAAPAHPAGPAWSLAAPGMGPGPGSAPWALLALLAALASCSPRGPGKDLLLPPCNVTLVSKDFSLFLTWIASTPGVFYTVQWINVYFDGWMDFPPCRNISETVCNITCMSPDLYLSFDVRVKAQARAGTVSSVWVNRRNIDYAVDVKLAPPVLQVRKTEDTIAVNTTFSDPSCLKSLFRDLTSDLEFWEAGTNNRKRFHMNTAKDFDATVFNSSNYCFSARANLNGVHSNFSEPTCIPLREEANTWALAAPPLSVLLIVFACVVCSFNQSRCRPKTVKSPQALDFSSYEGPKKFLEFADKEVTQVLTCTELPVILQNRSRHPPQMPSLLVPSVLEEEEEEEDDEEDDDIDSPRIYTETHGFQRNCMEGQMVGLGERRPDSASESGSSQLGEGSMPDLTLVAMKSAFGETVSGFQGSESTSLSAASSSEDSSACQDIYPATQGSQEDSDEDPDFLLQLSDSHLPTGKLFRTSEHFCEAHCETLQDPQIPLFRLPNNQDFFSLLLEDNKLSEEDSWGSGRLSPLKVTCRESLESSLLGGDEGLVEDRAPEPKSHGYRPRAVHYLSRIVQEFH